MPAARRGHGTRPRIAAPSPCHFAPPRRQSLTVPQASEIIPPPQPIRGRPMRHSLLALVLLPALARADAGPPLLLQRPAVSAKLVAFCYAGDLWVVGRDGGDARRLTAGVGLESYPVFSPDGETVAFAGEYEGNLDVYTVPAAGGVPRRLTHHPDPDVPVAWTPDGKNVLFRSPRGSYARFLKLFSVPVGGGQPTELPLPMAEDGSLSPDGQRIAYVPLSNKPQFPGAFRPLRNYRGGTAAFI